MIRTETVTRIFLECDAFHCGMTLDIPDDIDNPEQAVEWACRHKGWRVGAKGVQRGRTYCPACARPDDDTRIE